MRGMQSIARKLAFIIMLTGTLSLALLARQFLGDTAAALVGIAGLLVTLSTLRLLPL